jgi:ABC-type amino acid transport substrate-binding protein
MVKKLIPLVGLLALSWTLVSCGGPEETVAKIQREKVAYVGTVPFEGPLVYQEEGVLVGPDAELGHRIVQRMQETSDSLVDTPIRLTWINRTYSTLIPSMEKEEVDFILGLFAITEERKTKIQFSEPYYTSELVLLINPAHKDLVLDQVAGAKIGVREGTGVEELVKQKFTSSRVEPFKTVDDAVLALRRSEIDAVIDDKFMVAYSIETTPGAGHMEFGPETVGTIDYAVGIKKRDQALLSLVNGVIAEVKAAGDYPKWISEHAGSRVEDVLARRETRLKQKEKAAEPRQVTIRVSRAKNLRFDIYKMANLRFVLRERNTGNSYNSSPITFEGRVAVARAEVPPGYYVLALPKFNFRTNLEIGPAEPRQIPVRIILGSGGVEVRKG